MSHAVQRKEKDCLNCGAMALGRYCQNCGQENIEPKETFWHMVTHFFYDITHFDGSFFVTVKDLLFKPGFLSREYQLGRRKKYLHPVRMYVFTSAVFFLVFYALYHVSEKDIEIVNNEVLKGEKIKEFQKEALKNAKSQEDSMNVLKGLNLLGLKADTSERTNKISTSIDSTSEGGLKFSFGGDANKYRTVEEYDSAQKALASDKRSGWVTRTVTRKSVELNEKYKGDQKKIAAELVNKFMHSLPYLLFVSLPLYALFLKLLYTRHRKEYYFADHGVFLIHLYIFTFLFLLLYFGLDKLENNTGWQGTGYLQAALIFAGLFYAVKAMKNFYRQAWGKTILKFLLFNILCFFSLGLLFAVFLSLSLYQI